ncbi:MAG: putative C-S lyase [Geobacteraceae bacterium]|nr:putative C-S lyase [Geobacteraceae bacterium]
MINRFDFDTPVDRRGTSSDKWEKYAGRDIIPLWVADMDFRSPPSVIEELEKRVQHGVFGYTVTPPELIETVQAMLLSEYGWQVPKEWLVWMPGLVCGINLSCRAACELGEAIATFTPVYPPFLSAPRLAGLELITCDLRCDGDLWSMNLEELEKRLTPETRLLLLCSPHNPVGRVWTRDEQLALLDLAERHDLIVCSDEIHSGLVLDQDKQHIPFATLSHEAEQRTITLLAPSKTFNIAGLGCSIAIIADENLRHRFRRVMAGVVPSVNQLAYAAAYAAYKGGEEWRQSLVEYLRGNRDLVIEKIGEMPGLKAWPVEATYLIWIDARGLGVADPGAFFENAGVGLSDGTPFGAPGFLRLNFGCSRSLLVEALSRMKSAVQCLCSSTSS